MEDAQILHRITSMVNEETELRAKGIAGDYDANRLQLLEQELDRCWDLLRQRRAKREFGQDPNAAAPRDAQTVETYRG